MADSSEEDLGEALVACMTNMRCVLDKEVHVLCNELSLRLTTRFTELVAQSCGKLHSENTRLRQQLGVPPEKAVFDPAFQPLAATPCDRPQENNDKVQELVGILVVPEEYIEVDNPVVENQAEEEEGTLITDPAESHSEPERQQSGSDGMEMVPNRTSFLWRKSVSSSNVAIFDKYPGRSGICAPFMRSLVHSTPFEGLFSIMIVMNCVTMGLDAEQNVQSNPLSDRQPDKAYQFVLAAFEHMFTAMFSMELICKWCAHGYVAFTPSFPDGRWNIMDLFLVVVTGVTFTWIIPLLSFIFGFDGENSFVRILTVLRSVRLVRLVRVARRVPAFREAWLLLQGLTDSVRILFWTCIVIMFITYVFAIMGMVLISKEIDARYEAATNEQDKEELFELLEYVGSLDLFMYTLIQLLVGDSWNAIVRRVMERLSWCWLYFYAYIAVACFVLMNLVTAIIVENAHSNSQKDEGEALKQRAKKQTGELKQLESLFELMDADGSGTLSWDEFKAAFDDPEMTKKWKLLDFEPEECRELFGLLDDGDGEIETGEFFEGLAKMKGSAQSKDIFRLQKNLNILMGTLDTVRSTAEAVANGESIPVQSPRKKGTSAAGSSPRRHSPRNHEVASDENWSSSAASRTGLSTPRGAKSPRGTRRRPSPPPSDVSAKLAKAIQGYLDNLALRDAKGPDEGMDKRAAQGNVPAMNVIVDTMREESLMTEVDEGGPWMPCSSKENPGKRWKI